MLRTDQTDALSTLGNHAQDHHDTNVQVNQNTADIATNTTAIAGKYTKPASGIPKSDLDSATQTSLGKADSALQSAPVASVNTKTGVVVLNPDDLSDTATTNKFTTAADKAKLAAITGTNTGDETTATIKTKLGVTTLSGSNTGDQTLNGLLPTQTGNSGKVLSTDGTNASWATSTGGGTGTVTSVSVTSANGVSGAVATATTTPAISLSLGAITPTSVAATGAVSGSNLSGTNTGDETATTIKTKLGVTTLSGSNTGDQTNITGTAGTITGSITESQVTNLTTDLAAKQATLVSGTNIKTINGTTLLGSGDLVITGGGGTVTDATTTAKGVVQLAGDLAGTAALPTVPGLTAKAATTYVDSQDALKVSKAGDTMTGALTSPALKVNVASGNPEFVLQVGAVTQYKVFYDATNNLVAFQTPSTFNFGGSVLPQSTGAYTVGSPSLYWLNLYATRHYMNSTAYLDGATAGQITVTGLLSTPSLKVTGGTPAVGSVLTSDASGNATWQTPAAGGGTGDMTKAVYDPAAINQQVVGTTAAQTLTNKTLTTPAINSYATVSGAAATNRSVVMQTGTSNRLEIGASSTAESGSNAGSDLFINTFTDTGAYLATPVIMNRASGLLTANNGLNVAGGSLTVGGVAVPTVSSTSTLTNKTLDDTNIATVKDTNLTLEQTADVTRKAKFALTNPTTATTLTFSLPATTDTLVGKATTDTLSNKTIDTASTNTIKINGNTLAATAGTGTITLPNSSTTLVGLGLTQTLTAKTLTAPKIDQINDTNGNSALIFSPTVSAVNQLTVTNAATTASPSIAATGTATNLDVVLTPKGTGRVSTAANLTSGNEHTMAGSASAPTTPATGKGTITMSGTTNVRPKFINESGVVETILTDAGAVGSTLGYSQITTSFAGLSSTAVQDTGLTVTVTVPSGGRRVKLTGFGKWMQTVAANCDVQLCIQEGATVIASSRVTGTTAGYALAACVMSVSVPTAGSHTYKLTLQSVTTASAPTLAATATEPAFILAELI